MAPAASAAAGPAVVNSIDIEAPGGVAGSSVPETYQAVTPGYFEAAGISVVSGRTFGADDVSGECR